MEQKSDSEASQHSQSQHNFELSKNKLGIKKKTLIETEEQNLLPKKRLTIQKRTEIGRVPQADFNFLAEECKKATELLFQKQTTGHTEQEDNEFSEDKNNYNFPQRVKRKEIEVPQARHGTVLQNGSNNSTLNLQTIKVANQKNTSSLFDEKPAGPREFYSNALTTSPTMDYENNEEFMCEVVNETNINEQTDQLADQQIKLAIDSQNTIIQNQNMLLENQMRIIGQLAKQETMIQLICQNLSSPKTTAPTSKESDNATKRCDSIPDPLPIDTLAKLEEFEMDLRDETYMNKLIKCKSYICGTSGKLNGLNCSYRLIDCFFKRKLLLTFSWSGGSRKEEGKMAFKKYKNIMATFYKIISKADSQYTEMECQNFFKGVIKNAKRRFDLLENSTGKNRASSSKKRANDLNYRKVAENKIEIHTDILLGNSEETEENETVKEHEEMEEEVDN